MRAALLTAASQELRIPLTVIKGCAATLLQHERRLPRSEQREFLWTIRSATDQLEVTLDHLAQLAILETKARALKQAPTDLARLVRESIKALKEKHASQQKSPPATYRVRHPGRPGQRTRPRYLVRADPYWLSTALHFLLERAAQQKVGDEIIEVFFQPLAESQPCPISASPYPGGATVATEDALSTVPPNGRRVLTIIRCARPAEPERESVAPARARFDQIDSEASHEAAELGLGLMLCQRVLQLHGGEFRVERRTGSEPNTGARGAFHLLLPTEEGTSANTARNTA